MRIGLPGLGDAGRRHARALSPLAAAGEPVTQTWLRPSFEERRRVFDRLGNAHNPLLDYEWTMVERDIEQWSLRAYREDGDPTPRVFPWQDADGRPLHQGALKTKPNLRGG